MFDSDLNYRVLLSVTTLLNSQRDRRRLFSAITDQLGQVVPWERAGVTVYDGPADRFRFYALETNLPHVVLQPDATIPHIGSAVGWVHDHRRVHVRPQLQTDRRFIEDEWYVQEGLGRMINVPIVVQDSCLGTLNIGSIQAGAPDPEAVLFLQHIATQLGLAIAWANAEDELRRLRKRSPADRTTVPPPTATGEALDRREIIGRSRVFEQTMELVRRAAPTPTTVMLTGETGTGKELLAHALHEGSERRDRPFISVNCAALPAGLIESELFGHERGAFTGAQQQRIGRFEQAHGGTLFLDEIGDMPLEAQSKLLRVLQSGLIDRVGGTTPIPVDVRLIVATNADLHAAIAQGRFRSDVFYRIYVFPIHLPPLRERPEDIPLLARHFLHLHARRLQRPCEDFDDDSLERLVRHPWPGNIRELENVVERSVILGHDRRLFVDPAMISATGDESPSSRPTLQDEERRYILQALALCEWRIEGVDGAAAQLGLAPSTLRSRLAKLGIQRPIHK